MEVLDSVKQYASIIIICIYAALAKMYYNLDDSVLGVTVLFMFVVYYSASHLLKECQDNQMAADIKKIQIENDGLKRNLMQVYNMVKPVTKPPPSPHLPQQSPGGGISVPPREIPIVSQNSSSTPPQHGKPSLDDSSDPKPYA